MYRTFVFYLLDSREYKNLKYADKVSDVETWLYSKKLKVLEHNTTKNNKYKLIYFVELYESNDNHTITINELYSIPKILPFVYKVSEYWLNCNLESWLI